MDYGKMNAVKRFMEQQIKALDDLDELLAYDRVNNPTVTVGGENGRAMAFVSAKRTAYSDFLAIIEANEPAMKKAHDEKQAAEKAVRDAENAKRKQDTKKKADKKPTETPAPEDQDEAGEVKDSEETTVETTVEKPIKQVHEKKKNPMDDQVSLFGPEVY